MLVAAFRISLHLRPRPCDCKKEKCIFAPALDLPTGLKHAKPLFLTNQYT